MSLSKEADAARKRAARAAAKAAKEAEQEQGAEALAAICPENVEPDMSTMEALADMADEDARSAAEAAMSRRMAARYASGAVWACIIYPESCPADWEDKLRMTGLRAAASPLHDMDVQKDGTPKKPHYHVILQWDNAVSYRTAAAVSRGTLRGTLPIPLVSPRGYYRYFCHLDNPGKAQYDPAAIVRINGFDPGDFTDLTAAETEQLTEQLEALIDRLGLREYADLCTYLRHHGTAAENALVRRNTFHFSGYLRARRHSPPLVDPETGRLLRWKVDPDTGEIQVTGEREEQAGQGRPPAAGGGDFPLAENTTPSLDGPDGQQP